jgi:hypothetical protein
VAGEATQLLLAPPAQPVQPAQPAPPAQPTDTSQASERSEFVRNEQATARYYYCHAGKEISIDKFSSA